MKREYVLPRIYIGSGAKGKLLFDQIHAGRKRRKMSLARYARMCMLYVDINRPIPKIETGSEKKLEP